MSYSFSKITQFWRGGHTPCIYAYVLSLNCFPLYTELPQPPPLKFKKRAVLTSNILFFLAFLTSLFPPSSNQKYCSFFMITTIMGDRIFSVVAPKLLNELSTNIYLFSSICLLKHSLKFAYFRSLFLPKKACHLITFIWILCP